MVNSMKVQHDNQPISNGDFYTVGVVEQTPPSSQRTNTSS